MQKKKWILLTLMLVVSCFLVTVSCQKKVINATPQPVAEEKPVEKPKEAPPPPAPKAPDMTVMQEDIYFEFDKSTLTPTAQDNLLRKAEWLRQNSDATITIEGNCDERGTEEYNLALGDRRAESAKAFLVDLGINSARISTISYGEERPVDPRHNEEAWAKNRRDHFVVN
jgi:peptidoglycan-associated lipoprotein